MVFIHTLRYQNASHGSASVVPIQESSFQCCSLDEHSVLFNKLFLSTVAPLALSCFEKKKSQFISHNSLLLFWQGFF